DAAEYDRAIREQLLARGRKPAEQLARAVHVQTHELVRSHPLERDDLKIAVRCNGTSQELELPARLAFEVEDLLPRVAHVNQRFLLVVLEHALVIPNGNTEREPPRTRLRCVELHPYRRRLARARQRHFLGS